MLDNTRVPASPGRAEDQVGLWYFEDILPVEFEAINERRARINERSGSARPQEIRAIEPIRKLDEHHSPPLVSEPREAEPSAGRTLSPDPGLLPFARRRTGPPRGPRRRNRRPIDPNKPDYDKTRPRPLPCNVTGLAFSGGGVRSAAVCLGALQALRFHHRIDSIDYLSTVSGGGYMGACLSAAMSRPGGGNFPFGDDVSDSAAVGHLRNYSNYLLPRGRSNVANFAEAAAVILRGLAANIVVVLATLLGCTLLTCLAFLDIKSLKHGNFVLHLLDRPFCDWGKHCVSGSAVLDFPWSLTFGLLAVLGGVLVIWAALRSFPKLDALSDDTQSVVLSVARALIVAVVIVAFLDFQPHAIAFIAGLSGDAGQASILVRFRGELVGTLALYSGAISVASSWLGQFLKASQHTTDWTTYLLRGVTHVAVLGAAFVLPATLWGCYLVLSARALDANGPAANLFGLQFAAWHVFAVVFAILLAISAFLSANGYSLHRFYRDRLSKAFLFKPLETGDEGEPAPFNKLKLSALVGGNGPYHIINAAVNVQGSAEANRRGRDADFFMFSRDFVGCDLTLFAPLVAPTAHMEQIDPRLDLATAMAISGAAVSANMGSNTVRFLSPTLALLNIRLGYWLRNPRDLAQAVTPRRRIAQWTERLLSRFYLLLEMLNLLDEKRRFVYLTDGGHIENLGAYELIKRGCQLIIVIDAEADPSMSFGSLLKLERYARIDLGARITLPWEEIARMTKSVGDRIASGNQADRAAGPHCAIGRIVYENGAKGIILYFKASLTGDEKDYVLDYKKRYPAFPHETTADQFFSEEQFEAYRALGFHMVDGFFSRPRSGKDNFSWLDSRDGWPSADDAFAEVEAAVPAIP